MGDDRRWDERDWREGRRERGESRWRRMHEDRRHEGPAGYNDSGPVQGGWSFGDPEQGGDQGQGYERYGYGRGGDDYRRGREDYAYGPYTPYGYRGRGEYDGRGRGGYGAEPRRRDEERSWLERAGDRVAEFFGEGQSHRGRGPRGYKRPDARILEDVNDRLTDDPWIDASAVEVEVRDGEVTLSGFVKNRPDKRRAEMLAESVLGVGHVQNNLRQEAAGEDTVVHRDITGLRESAGRPATE